MNSECGINGKRIDSEKIRLKVISYNIKNGHEVGYDYAVIGRDIASEDAELVGLQELDRNTERNGKRDALSELAEAAGYRYTAYTHAIDYMGGEYGTGIMSKYPIKDFYVVELQSHGREQRSAGVATIDIEGRELTYINTHLSLGKPEMRRDQFLTLAELVRDKELYVITGDFNTECEEEFSPIVGAQLLNREGLYRSCEGQAIDNILTPEGVAIISSFMRDECGHSDHCMIGGIYEI